MPIAATIGSTAEARTTKQDRIQLQLNRYYHADGFIKSIGHVAYRTIYSSNPVKRSKWKKKLRHLMDVRSDAKQKLDSLRQPAHPIVDSCTDALIKREGGYNPHATNPYSGAYGVPQALPGEKMASAGSDWRDNIWTQIRWMQGYMNARYGGSCPALAHSYAYGWY